MSIKRYNTFHCTHTNKNKKPKKNFPAKTKFKKSIIGIFFLLFVLAGIKLFFTIPFMSLGLEEEKQTEIPQTEIVQNKSNPLSGTFVDDTKNTNNKEMIQGLEKISDELDQLALRDECIDENQLQLKYQKKIQEEKRRISGNLSSGETIYQHLVKNNISPSEVLALQERVQSVVDISCLNVGTKFSAYCNSKGEIVQFDYQPNQLDVYHIEIPPNQMGNIKVTKDEIFREIVCFEGEISSSLYQSMLDYCNSGQLAVYLAEIFAWDIDFLTECQPGDTFKILVEKLYRGDFYRWGDILAAVYEGEMLSTHTALLFENPDGQTSYYDENGRSLQKAFLKAPLNYKYISSNFSKSRFHPILRIWRPHLAIDYAAPTGTPVVSIGAGTVISRYYDQGGYGNYVQIRHPNGYVTGYGHLSKFAQGLQKGQRVEQGEIIGYVGATGLATGPHLDFSISKDGQRVNFLEIELPPADSVKADYRQDFDLVRENYLSILKENL